MGVEGMINRPVVAVLLALASSLVLAFCGGGGGGSTTTTELTSMSQLRGTYKLKTAETITARSYDIDSLEVYTAVDPPYYSNYGKNGTCFSLATIVSETKTDSGLQVTMRTESVTGGLPPCGQYVIDTAGITARAAGVLPDVSTFQNGADETITGTFMTGPDGDGFFVEWPVTPTNDPPLIDRMQFLCEPFSHDVPIVGYDEPLFAPGSWPQILDQANGDTANGGTGGGATPPTEPPAATLKCTDLWHGTGESYIMACVKYENVPPGTGVTFTVSGGGSVAEAAATVGEDGWACVTATIYTYGDYSWRAGVETAAGASTETGDITVGPEEQRNCSSVK